MDLHNAVSTERIEYRREIGESNHGYFAIREFTPVNAIEQAGRPITAPCCDKDAGFTLDDLFESCQTILVSPREIGFLEAKVRGLYYGVPPTAKDLEPRFELVRIDRPRQRHNADRFVWLEGLPVVFHSFNITAEWRDRAEFGSSCAPDHP